MAHDDYEDPTKRDPRFPDRPTHPDFIRLSQVVQDHDIRTERLGANPFDVLGVDERSFMYFLENRLGIFEQRTHRTFEGRMKTLISALYMDAFALGKDYTEAKEAERRREVHVIEQRSDKGVVVRFSDGKHVSFGSGTRLAGDVDAALGEAYGYTDEEEV